MAPLFATPPSGKRYQTFKKNTMKQWNYEIKNNPKDISEKLEFAPKPDVYQTFTFIL